MNLFTLISHNIQTTSQNRFGPPGYRQLVSCGGLALGSIGSCQLLGGGCCRWGVPTSGLSFMALMLWLISLHCDDI